MEHVWKGPDGAQKNIPLPFAIIQEDNEDDPDNLTNLLRDKTEESKT